MQPTFKIGDKAVYRNHGVAVITGIETIEMSGASSSVYVLEVMDSKRDRVMIPVDKVNSVGLRNLITPEEIDEVYDILRERPGKTDSQTWNRRQRKYNEKIGTGSVYDIAEVLRDLSILKYEKTLSFGEKRMLDRAQQLLVKELAVARELEETVIEAEIEALFAGTAPPGAVVGGEPEKGKKGKEPELKSKKGEFLDKLSLSLDDEDEDEDLFELKPPVEKAKPAPKRTRAPKTASAE